MSYDTFVNSTNAALAMESQRELPFPYITVQVDASGEGVFYLPADRLPDYFTATGITAAPASWTPRRVQMGRDENNRARKVACPSSKKLTLIRAATRVAWEGKADGSAPVYYGGKTNQNRLPAGMRWVQRRQVVGVLWDDDKQAPWGTVMFTVKSTNNLKFESAVRLFDSLTSKARNEFTKELVAVGKWSGTAAVPNQLFMLPVTFSEDKAPVGRKQQTDIYTIELAHDPDKPYTLDELRTLLISEEAAESVQLLSSQCDTWRAAWDINGPVANPGAEVAANEHDAWVNDMVDTYLKTSFPDSIMDGWTTNELMARAVVGIKNQDGNVIYPTIESTRPAFRAVWENAGKPMSPTPALRTAWLDYIRGEFLGAMPTQDGEPF